MFNPGQRYCPSALSLASFTLSAITLFPTVGGISDRAHRVVTYVKLITRAFRHTHVRAICTFLQRPENFVSHLSDSFFRRYRFQSGGNTRGIRNGRACVSISSRITSFAASRGWKRPWRLSIGFAFALARRRAFLLHCCYRAIINARQAGIMARIQWDHGTTAVSARDSSRNLSDGSSA